MESSAQISRFNLVNVKISCDAGHIQPQYVAGKLTSNAGNMIYIYILILILILIYMMYMDTCPV